MYGEFISDYEKLQSLKEEDLPKRNLYTVEIPDDNGSNYLYWKKPINSEIQERVANGLQSIGFEFEPEMNYLAYSRDGKIAVLNINAKGEDLYAELSEALGDEKAASQFLNDLGRNVQGGMNMSAEERRASLAEKPRTWHARTRYSCMIILERVRWVQKKKSSFSERSGVIPGNSSSKRLLQAGNGHLSTNSLTSQEDVAKLVKNTQNTIRSANKKINEGGLNNLRTVENTVRKVSETLKLVKAKSTQSFYGDLYEGDFLVGGKSLHLRISTHPATCERMGNHSADDKISIVIYKNVEHISREEHDGYTEYTYYPEEVSLEDASNAIIKGVLNLVNNGEFVDEIGKAHRQEYPFVNEDNDIRFRSVGGNSGYVGYSMSKRAAEAREEGRFPKIDFKKEYDMPQQTLDALVEAGIIDNSEWHHTSKIGNRTTFYGWTDEAFADIYAENKKEIDALAKEVNANIAELEKVERDFLDSWKGYQYPELFDWNAYRRRVHELEDLPYNERMDILRSEFPETAEKEKHDSRQQEFSREIDNRKREQRKRINELFTKNVNYIVSHFNRENAGAAPCVVIKNIDTLEAQLKEVGFSNESIEGSMESFKEGCLAEYNPNEDYVVIYDSNASEYEIIGYLWHENAHKEIGKVYTQEEIDNAFNFYFKNNIDKVYESLENYPESLVPEEALIRGFNKSL